jgi:hypothetical protein
MSTIAARKQIADTFAAQILSLTGESVDVNFGFDARVTVCCEGVLSLGKAVAALEQTGRRVVDTLSTTGLFFAVLEG